MKHNIKKSTLFLTQAGVIAAAYVALTAVSSAFGLAYGEVQFRLSEALTILPVFTPAAIPGLAVGCAIANIGSTLGAVDIVCGAAASLLAAVATRYLGRFTVKGLPLLSALPPVVFNAVIVGLELALVGGTKGAYGSFAATFWMFSLFVGAGQAAVCFGLGLPLAAALRRARVFASTAVISQKP